MEQYFKFPKSSFSEFLGLLQAFGRVYAPVRVSPVSFEFKEVHSQEQIAFEALRTILPAKKFFYPQNETLLRYDGDEIIDGTPQPEPQVIFGVHPCDLAGLGIMDTLYMAEPIDTHYKARRDTTLVVGLSCMPDKHCFCKSMGTSSPTDSPASTYDIFLTDIGDEYFVEVNTAIGHEALKDLPELFSGISDGDREKFKQFWITRDESFVTDFPSADLPAIMDLERDNPLWKELGSRCLSCGNCTFVCPTCYCFDIIDIPSLHSDSGERIRQWDSCQINGFAVIADGTNFRPDAVDRYKFWYRHKLHGFDDPWGYKGCVGCGRCTVSCPASICDIVDVVKQLQGSSDGTKKDDH